MQEQPTRVPGAYLQRARGAIPRPSLAFPQQRLQKSRRIPLSSIPLESIPCVGHILRLSVEVHNGLLVNLEVLEAVVAHTRVLQLGGVVPDDLDDFDALAIRQLQVERALRS